MSLASQGGLCPLLYAYLVGLIEQAPRLTAAASETVARNFTELLGAAIDEAVAGSPLPLSEYRATALLRIKDFVERHLDDHDFEPMQVASALRLSPRYINKLFEAEGTSLVRYVWRRRLERSAADLRNPAFRGQTLSTIALRHGFNDLSHFGRVFRQRFGSSPRDYRLGGDQGR